MRSVLFTRDSLVLYCSGPGSARFRVGLVLFIRDSLVLRCSGSGLMQGRVQDEVGAAY